MPNRELFLKKLRLDEDATDNEISVAYEKLRLTYELVAISSNDSGIKEIAEKKLRELEQLAGSSVDNMNLKIEHSDEYDEIVKAAYRLLENGRAKQNQLESMIGRLQDTTMTAENFYLQTLMYLEINNGYPGCQYAKQTIENALVIEPDNVAYQALKAGIDSVIKAKIDYDEKQQRILQKELEEQQARQKQLEAQAQAEKRRAICGGIFECICVCMGGLVQCMCSLCTCCDDCC